MVAFTLETMLKTERTLLAAAMALLAGGCASGGAPNATPDTTPAVLVDQSGRITRTTEAPTTASFPTPPDSTFRALVAAFDTLGFGPAAVDPTQRVVAQRHAVFRSRFDGQPLSAAFDCGDGQVGPRANNGRITAEIISRVIPTGTGSTISTTIDASLVPNDGVSRDPIRCVSHGGIEERLRREVSIELDIPYRVR